MKQSESIKELAKALCKAQALMEGAKKDSANPYFKSKYANLEAVWECARKPLHDNGLSVVQMPGKSELGHYLETMLMHESGEFVSSQMFIAPVKEDPQGIGSAITYARRYSLMSALGIAPEDDDGEAAMGRGSNHQSKPVAKEPIPNKIVPWKETIWHMDWGVSKDKQFAYVGKTLKEILDNDPEGLAYWHREWKPGKLPNDIALFAAMGQALSEKASKESAERSTPKDKVVKPKVKSKLEELQELCSANEVLPSFILDLAKQKGKAPEDAKTLADVPPDTIEAALQNFAYFIKKSKENA